MFRLYSQHDTRHKYAGEGRKWSVKEERAACNEGKFEKSGKLLEMTREKGTKQVAGGNKERFLKRDRLERRQKRCYGC